MALEDRLQTEKYESQLEQKLGKKSGWLKMAFDAMLYTPVVAASAFAFGSAVTLSTAIPAIGYSIGAWIENRKKKTRMTWNRVKRELYTGNVMGHVDYWAFSMPEKLFTAYPAIFNNTWTGMLATSLVFNPLLFIPVNIAYSAFFYLRDKIGFGNAAKGFFNGKFSSHAKDTYRNVKKNLWGDTKNVFKYMFPLHFFQTHYLPGIAQRSQYLARMPEATLRMTQSALINNPLYRILMSTKKKEENYGQIRASNYNPAYA